MLLFLPGQVPACCWSPGAAQQWCCGSSWQGSDLGEWCCLLSWHHSWREQWIMHVDISALTSSCYLFVLYGKNIFVWPKEDLAEQTGSCAGWGQACCSISLFGCRGICCERSFSPIILQSLGATCCSLVVHLYLMRKNPVACPERRTWAAWMILSCTTSSSIHGAPFLRSYRKSSDERLWPITAEGLKALFVSLQIPKCGCHYPSLPELGRMETNLLAALPCSS